MAKKVATTELVEIPLKKIKTSVRLIMVVEFESAGTQELDEIMDSARSYGWITKARVERMAPAVEELV